MPVLVLTAGASVFHGDQGVSSTSPHPTSRQHRVAHCVPVCNGLSAEEPTEGPIGMAFIVVLLVAGFVAFAASFLLTQSQQTQRQGPVRMLQYVRHSLAIAALCAHSDTARTPPVQVPSSAVCVAAAVGRTGGCLAVDERASYWRRGAGGCCAWCGDTAPQT